MEKTQNSEAESVSPSAGSSANQSQVLQHIWVSITVHRLDKYSQRVTPAGLYDSEQQAP